MPHDPAFATPGRFYKGNIHTHSTASDGRLAPDEVCRRYREAGYDFLALTDHFMAKYDFPIVDTRPFRTSSFTTLIGAEVHAPETSLGEIWHLLAVGLPLEFAQTAADERAPELAARCAASGAFVAIAHPTWYALSEADAETIAVAHAVEVYNHTSQVRTDRGDGSYLLDQLLASGRRINACAVDDAHFHCNDAFGAFVMVKAQANEPELLLAALKAGAYYSSQGPRIDSVTFHGGAVEVVCSPAASIMALGRGSRAVQKREPDATRAVLSLDRIGNPGFVRMVVMDSAGRRAWTNPVWL
jgi:hypothetical protein